MQCLTYVQCLIRNPVRFDLRFTFVGANDGATSCDVLIALRLTGHRPDTANAFCAEAGVAWSIVCLNTAGNFALVTSNPFLEYGRLEQMVSTLDFRGPNILKSVKQKRY
ncbi:hypothetical protein DPMN_070240 [Dreissena polymorpha]|uniref:Uncharacterized protein n=1 Tax=Dreissena polymorpha TaxID=45954 RepID=A0A9D4BNR7_DREPO|nr:hypothetical protein DPMN_070240 [Dreissena polymorpha]